MPLTPHPSSAASPETSVAEPFAASFGGVLLDLDGTLIDSIPAVVRSWVRWCGEYDVDPVRLTGFHGVTALERHRGTAAGGAPGRGVRPHPGDRGG